jgi:GAF domain-containing protein/HAMP domain-containing protein/anti-sigma regulatory factor (Ser/Thr protein kinase)
MLFRSSLRAKTLLYVLIPTAVGLVAVATIALYAYERVAHDVVQQRDAEFATLQAARLSEGLHEYIELLQDYALLRDVQSMDVNRLIDAIAKAPSEFQHFNAGVVVFDEEGVALWAMPPLPRRRGTNYPLPSQFDEVHHSLQPSLSDIFTDPLTGEEMISLAVPVTDADGNLQGVVAGLQTIRSSTFSEVYAELLQISPGQSRQAYVVDGNGRVIYGDPSRLGASLSNWAPVARAIGRESGAVLVEDQAGDAVISGFAPVPDLGWALFTQQRWDDIVRPIRRYSNLLVGVLIIAGLSSGVLVFLSIGRALRPIHDLTQGAQRIAGGDFDYTIIADTGDEVQALGQQFNLMAEALRESYHDLERRVADRTQELAALNAIAQVVSSTLDLQEVLDDALDKTLEVMKVEAGGVYLLRAAESQPDEGILTIASYKGVGPDFVAAVDNLKMGEGFSGRVAQTGKPLVVPDLSSDPRLTRSVVTESGFRAVAIVPLASRDRIWGSLFAMTRTAREFSEQDVDLLSNIADQIAVAIENATLFEAEQRRAEQFRVITEVGGHITSILDVDELLREIVRLLKTTFGYYQVTIGLIEGDQLVFRAGAKAELDDSQFVPPPTKVGGEGITAWVAATGRPLLAPDVTKEPRFLFLPTSPETRSELAVPLRTKEGIIGVLNVESDQVNAFDESDLTLLQSLANQAAIAIENAGLFHAEQRRAEQFRVISDVGGHITSILDVDDLLREIVRLIRETFRYHIVGISLVEGDELTVRAGAGPPFDDPEFHAPRVRVGGEGITGWVSGTGEPALVHDVRQDDRYIPLSEDAETRSELCVPFKTKEAVIGVLNVESDKPSAFDVSDLVVLQSLASQAAVAIENARLYEDVRSRLAQVTALQETTKAVASTLELDRLLDLITEEATALLQADGGILNLVDWEAKEDQVVASTGAVAFSHGYRGPLEGSLSGWVTLHGQPILSGQLQADPKVDQQALSWTHERTRRQLRSAAVAPLSIKSRVMGTLMVVDKRGGDAEFDQTDLDLLAALANQAAVAIENANLFDAVQRRAEQFRVLSEVGARITSLLEVDELLQETVRLVNEVLGYYLVGIGLIEGDELVVKAGAGPRWADPDFQPPRLPVGEGISGWVAQTGEPLLAPDVSREPRFLRLPDSAETRSELAVPLKAKTAVIGVLDVQSEKLNAFDESDLVVLQSLANLTAIALEEARLFDAEQRRAEQFRVISEVGASITSILTVDDLLQEIVRLVKTSLGYYHTAIGLVDGDELVMKAGVGAHWEDPGFQPSRLLVGGQGITAWVAASGEPLLVPDVTEDARYLLLPGSEEIRSEVAVPLKTASGVIGVLDVQSNQANGLDQSDLAVLKSVAHQAAIAIENARLYEQSQQAAALEERSRLARDLHDAVTQTLFSASLIGEVVPTVWESDETEGRKLLQELRQLTRGALAEMRTLLLELRPAALVESSLDDLLRQLCEAASGRSGLAIKVVIEGDERELPPDVHVALYRIAQEALNNVVKHARAADAQVRLRCTAPAEGADAECGIVVELSVTDNGRGFDPDQESPDRLGLGIIRERAEAIGGTLRIESEPGMGTQVSVLWHEEAWPLTQEE